MAATLLPFLITTSVWILLTGLSAYVLKLINERMVLPPWVWLASLLLSLLIFLPLPSNVVSDVIDITWIQESNLPLVADSANAAISETVSITPIKLFLHFSITVFCIFTFRRILKLAKNANRLKALVKDGMPVEKSLSPVSLYITPLASSPFVTGMFKPIIALPEYFLHLSRKEKHIVLAHEYSHIRTGDHKTIYIWRFLVELFWFNPFLRFFEQGFIQSIEFRCDHNTLKRSQFSAHEYAKTLLRCLKLGHNTQARMPFSDLAVGFSIPTLSFGDFKKRLSYINGDSEHQNSPLKAIIPLTLVAFAMIATNSALAALNQANLNWVYPVADPVISSDFKDVSALRNHRPHKGIDFMGITGTPIYASANGKVVLANDNTLPSPYGQAIVIQHKQKWQSLYAHLSEIFVESGQTVKQGELIGLMGATGRVTGPHLHFEMAHNQSVVDPKHYLEPLNFYQNAMR